MTKKNQEFGNGLGEQGEREEGQGGKTPSSERRQTAATALKNLPLEGATQAPAGLSERYREVLNLLVTDYIATSEAVGSKQLSHRIARRLSPATIRNVMADLEEMGYLLQRHTSAGRIPTEKGLRYYVDSLVEQRPLSEEEQKTIQSHYPMQDRDIRSLLKQTGKALASISSCMGLVMTPNMEKMRFKHIEFLPLSRGRLLGIFVAETGMVENRVLETGGELNYRELERINNYCNASFLGLTLDEAREKIGRELTCAQREFDKLISKALLFSQELLENIQTSDLLVEGQSQRLRELIDSLKEKNQLLGLLDSSLQGSGVQIFIGKESGVVAASDLSLVTAPYHQRGNVLGTLGVIGPVQMDYKKVIPMVDFTAKLVSRLLD